MPQEMLPKITLFFGLIKFKKFCKIKVAGEEWTENPTVSSLNAVISTNERNEFITDQMTYYLAYP